MKSRKRSQSTKKPSFPEVAPKEPATGNERITFEVEGLPPITMEVPLGKTSTNIGKGFLPFKTEYIPFISVAVFSRDREGVIKASINLLKPAHLQPTGKKAGLAIMNRLFPNFYRVSKREPKNPNAWRTALALDCASVFKNPSEMGQIQLENNGQWKAWVNAERKNRKNDKLNYLLANSYEREGWAKIPLAQVGVIVGKILKLKKPVPTSTLNRRLADLGFGCLSVGRPPNVKYK